MASWADRFSSALDSHKVMALSNGEKLQLSSNMRLIFETANLKDASPSLLSRTVIELAEVEIITCLSLNV